MYKKMLWHLSFEQWYLGILRKNQKKFYGSLQIYKRKSNGTSVLSSNTRKKFMEASKFTRESNGTQFWAVILRDFTQKTREKFMEASKYTRKSNGTSVLNNNT